MVGLGRGFHLGLADSRSLLRQKDIMSLWGRLPSRPVTFTLLSTGQEAYGKQVQTAARQRGEEEGKKGEKIGRRPEVAENCVFLFLFLNDSLEFLTQIYLT